MRPKSSFPADSAAIVVISPHFDDGVLSCGQLLASYPGSIVVTALAGRPSSYGKLTAWDAAAGFQAGDDVVAARRAEDQAALAALGARPVWLDFCDEQYGHSPTLEMLAGGLARAIRETKGRVVFAPLGLSHPDHKRTNAAVSTLIWSLPDLDWFAYEDAIYRCSSHALRARLKALSRVGIDAVRAGSSSNHGLAEKRQAIQLYPSQIRALCAPGHPGYHDALKPERYWRLSTRLDRNVPVEPRQDLEALAPAFRALGEPDPPTRRQRWIARLPSPVRTALSGSLQIARLRTLRGWSDRYARN
ncbi:MAG TPA: PIG-L family deacetylase [Chloroflexota bacterium]|nr:PIG-L family deacetylase [Chloroflexota bacterium]